MQYRLILISLTALFIFTACHHDDEDIVMDDHQVYHHIKTHESHTRNN